MVSQMDWKEWKTAAKYDGFERIEVVTRNQGWGVVGVTNDRKAHKLQTRRGDTREFASLATAAKYLSKCGVGSFKVIQYAGTDMFGDLYG